MLLRQAEWCEMRVQACIFLISHAFIRSSYALDPVFNPWYLPHSCGERCDKALVPQCGHSCVLLCHPGKQSMHSCVHSCICHAHPCACMLTLLAPRRPLSSLSSDSQGCTMPLRPKHSCAPVWQSCMGLWTGLFSYSVLWYSQVHTTVSRRYVDSVRSAV